MKIGSKQIAIIWTQTIIVLLIAVVVYWYMIYRKYNRAAGLLAGEISLADVGLCILSIGVSIGIVMGFIKILPMKLLYDENVRMLADTFTIKFLAVFFVPNALCEELIFRGAIQLSIGIIPAAFIFAVFHVSYYKRPILLLEVFIQGLVLGILFKLTGSLWITTAAHMAVNTIECWMIQNNIIEYQDQN